MEYTEEHLKSIIGDVAYLVDEAEALSYVIGNVPASEKTGGIESIIEMIALIDHAQLTYYRPVCEKLFSVPNVDDTHNDFRNNFSIPEEQTKEPEKIIRKIARNRSAFVDFITKIPLKDLRQQGVINGKKVTIASVLEEMVTFERKQLKTVAERVLSIDNTLNKSRSNKAE